MTTQTDTVAVQWRRDHVDALGRILGHMMVYLKSPAYLAHWQDTKWDEEDMEDVAHMHALMVEHLPKDIPAPRARVRPTTVTARADAPERRGRIIRRPKPDR